MPVLINAGTAGDLNPGFDGSRAPVATAVGVVRRTTATCSLGNVLTAQVAFGWDQVSGSARVVMPSVGGSLGDTLNVTLGAGNNVQRFHGTLRQFDTVSFPHAVTAVGKGPLFALEEFRTDVESVQDNQPKPGLDLADLIGTTTGTLQQIVTAVLSKAGVGYSTSNLANPAHVYGLDGLGKPTYNDALVWGTHETAASYIHRFLEASAGYRLFDSSDGGVYLKQITATPGASPGTPGTTSTPTFTLGVDIFGDSTASTSSIGLQNAVLVEGWDDGSGPATSGIVGSGASAFRVSSTLIETDAFATELANFWLPQVSRNQRIVRLTTHRDDLLGPGATIDIDAAGLGIVDTMWIKSLTVEVAADGAFSQHLICVAGA